MGLDFRNLDASVRALMVEEIQLDVDSNALYASSYFTDAGALAWQERMVEAATHGNDDSLAASLSMNGGIKHQTTRDPKNGTTFVKVPINAAEVIAESNFSRFYMRALCRHALNSGQTELIGYRAKYVENPRPGSEEKIGAAFDAARTLADVRATMSTAPEFGMPPGPNSGILAYRA